jgi:LytS/YehU family sensor histidine kinase
MREAELAAARTRQFAAIGGGATALLLAGVLAVAYSFKRRAAVALAGARDAAELRAENAQLLALRYQLNPHFLFNAFNLLRARVTSRPADAVGLIDRLTAFCRQTLLRRPEGIGTVADEIAMLSSYLEIEQTRWEENLRLTRRFDPAARDRLLPSFLLLPLLENALKYGAQTSERTVVVEMAIEVEGNSDLAITVSNSGRWIPPGEAPRRSSTGTGLTNLRRRLERYYPDRHRFTIGPEADRVVARLILHGDPQTTAAAIAS